MISYKICALYQTKICELLVEPTMSRSSVVGLIGFHLGLSEDSFQVQIYDERFHDYIDFDEEYAEKLQERLPCTYSSTLNARVTCFYRHDFENVSEQPTESQNMVSSLFTDDKSLLTDEIKDDAIGVPPLDELLLTDNTSKIGVHFSADSIPSNSVETLLAGASNPLTNLTFTRDVAPYQRQKIQSEMYQKRENIQTDKEYYISRVQGVKCCHDTIHASILPEIKVSSFVQFENSICDTRLFFASRFHSYTYKKINLNSWSVLQSKNT